MLGRSTPGRGIASFDTGGTFPDIIVLDPQDHLHIGKALMTPDRISEWKAGALAGVARPRPARCRTARPGRSRTTPYGESARHRRPPYRSAWQGPSIGRNGGGGLKRCPAWHWPIDARLFRRWKSIVNQPQASSRSTDMRNEFEASLELQRSFSQFAIFGRPIRKTGPA